MSENQTGYGRLGAAISAEAAKRNRLRRQCSTCGKYVATYANGQLWDHYVPGYGLWSDPPLRCKGSGTVWAAKEASDAAAE